MTRSEYVTAIKRKLYNLADMLSRRALAPPSAEHAVRETKRILPNKHY